MTPLRLTRAGLVGTLATLVVAAACIRLGIWQLDRLEQRRERNAVIAERLAEPPVRLDGPVTDPAGLLYRRVALRGEYDHARSVVLPGRTHQGVPGVYLLTPLRFEGGHGAVLVNRGWIPSPDAATVDITAFDEPGAVVLEGLVVPLPDRSRARAAARREPTVDVIAAADAGGERASGPVLYDLDVEAFVERLPYAVAPLYVQALPGPGGAREYPVRLDAPSLDDGPHLGYAFQWFSFAAIAVIGWTALALRKGEVGRERRG